MIWNLGDIDGFARTLFIRFVTQKSELIWAFWLKSFVYHPFQVFLIHWAFLSDHKSQPFGNALGSCHVNWHIIWMHLFCQLVPGVALSTCIRWALPRPRFSDDHWNTCVYRFTYFTAKFSINYKFQWNRKRTLFKWLHLYSIIATS